VESSEKAGVNLPCRTDLLFKTYCRCHGACYNAWDNHWKNGFDKFSLPDEQFLARINDGCIAGKPVQASDNPACKKRF